MDFTSCFPKHCFHFPRTDVVSTRPPLNADTDLCDRLDIAAYRATTRFEAAFNDRLVNPKLSPLDFCFAAWDVGLQAIGYLPVVERALKRGIDSTKLWIDLTNKINEKAYEIAMKAASPRFPGLSFPDLDHFMTFARVATDGTWVDNVDDRPPLIQVLPLERLLGRYKPLHVGMPPNRGIELSLDVEGKHLDGGDQHTSGKDEGLSHMYHEHVVAPASPVAETSDLSVTAHAEKRCTGTGVGTSSPGWVPYPRDIEKGSTAVYRGVQSKISPGLPTPPWVARIESTASTSHDSRQNSPHKLRDEGVILPPASSAVVGGIAPIGEHVDDPAGSTSADLSSSSGAIVSAPSLETSHRSTGVGGHSERISQNRLPMTKSAEPFPQASQLTTLPQLLTAASEDQSALSPPSSAPTIVTPTTSSQEVLSNKSDVGTPPAEPCRPTVAAVTSTQSAGMTPPSTSKGSQIWSKLKQKSSFKSLRLGIVIPRRVRTTSHTSQDG